LRIKQLAGPWILALSICIGLPSSGVCAVATAATPAETAITDTDVADAVTKVKADPNLAHEKTIRKLSWLDENKKEQENKKDQRKSNAFGWIGDLFRFIAQTSRVIVWMIIAVAVGLLVIAIMRIVRSIQPSTHIPKLVAPTHVRELDIRPESLPDDIGAEVLALWEQGAHRAALALLYRGLLSRLVHVHEIPIRHSSTEGDCLQLAVQRLQGERGDYVTRVIRTWQRAIYGAQEPQASEVNTLCSGFDAALSKSLASPAT
jgi:hypothetical protein